MELHEITEQAPERALLVSVDTGEFDAAVSLAELAEHTADRAAPAAEPVGTVPAAVRIFLQWRDLSIPGCRPEQSDLPDQWA